MPISSRGTDFGDNPRIFQHIPLNNPNSSMMTTGYDTLPARRKLGAHHFAYLRALAEGIDQTTCARLYLDAHEPAEVREAHQETVDTARAIARRKPEGRTAWRLIGLLVSPKKHGEIPTLEAFIESKDLQDWGEDECLAWYLEAYPEQASTARRKRLLERQINLLRAIESTALSAPDAADAIAGWFDAVTAHRLATAGMQTLGDLVRRIHESATWHARVPSIGATKASRIAAQAVRLIPEVPPPRFALDDPAQQQLLRTWASDGNAPTTERKYEREAIRLCLWLQMERGALPLLEVQHEDCLAYAGFLQALPAAWISESQARIAPFAPGWTPFREQPGKESQADSIAAITTLYSWLCQTGRIAANPWRPHQAARRAGRPKGGANPFADKLPMIQARISGSTPSLERSLVAAIAGLLDIKGLSAQALTRLQIADLCCQPGGEARLKLGKGTVDLPSAVAAHLEDVLDRRESVRSQPGAPLLCHPRFTDRPLAYRAITGLIDQWAAPSA